MYMRMVQVKVKPGLTSELRLHYHEQIIAALSGISGCRYAGLLQSVHHPEECISLTLWDSEQDSHAYEKSGLFTSLLDRTRPFLLDSTESKIQLSQDLTLEYVPIPEEPVVSVLPVTATSNQAASGDEQGSPMWVRIVSLKIQPGKLEEFKRLYEEQVIPKLRSVRGCRYIYLSERAEKKDEVISVTSWNSKEDAERYEKSGTFELLLRSQEHVLSELYQWKRTTQKEHQGLATTSDDPMVEYFDVLVSKAFK